jgi:hypothetical protein
MILAMTSSAKQESYSTFEVVIEWDQVVERNEKEFADTIKTIIEALVEAVTATVPIMSQEAAVNLLASYIDTMHEYANDNPEIPGERERIMKDRLASMRLEDSQFLESQLDEIDQLLEEAGVNPQDPQISKLADQLKTALAKFKSSKTEE